MSTQRIGFIGTGVMGSGMIRNLQKAGYPVNITTRTKAKAEELIQEGCHWFDSQAELAAQSDVVISMVGYPQDVESVYFGEHGVFRGKQGGFVIDMTTSSPSLANLAPRMLKGDTKPGFYIKHFLKDMRIAIESAEEMGLDLPGLCLAKKLYDQLAAQGMENCGTQALFQWYDRQ